MSRIDELIDEYCPEGVPYALLRRVTQNFDNLRRPVTKSQRSSGIYPYYGANGVQDYVEEYIFDGTFLLIGEDGSVKRPNGTPFLHWASGKIWVNNHAHVLQSKTKDVDLRFLYYYLQTQDISSLVTGGTQLKLNQGNLNRIRVAVPPLEVQREIVRILDQFTLLEAELEAELEARRRQYEHYRESLLATDIAKSRRLRLDELFNLRAGNFIASSKIVVTSSDVHSIPCFGGGGLRGYVTEPNQRGDLVLIGRQGALCGNVKRASGEFYATEHAVVVTPLAGIDIRWAFHLLTGMNLNQYASKSAQPGLAVGTLNRLVVQVPSLDEQLCIGSILDKFEALVNDLGVGLPAELVARRKQYEYYRDRLLTFEELSA